MTTPTPDTLTEVYDRLRRVRLRHVWARRRPRPAQLLALLVLAAFALVGCGLPATVNGLPVRICGTVADEPVRVPDDHCPADGQSQKGTPFRWYEADRRCLDAGDRTDIWQPVNDDYLGEPCDPKRSPVIVVAPAPKLAPPPSTWKARATTSRPTPRPTAR